MTHTASTGLHIVVACGGTGGHVMPGLATALALRARGHRPTLWMTGKEIEEKSTASWNGEVVRVPAQGFPTSISLRSMAAAYTLWRAVRVCCREMRKNRPDAVLAMGSYASAGPVGAARRLGIPYVLHEANVLPGRAVRFLAGRAAVVACHFEETRFHLKGKPVEITGMPLRRELDPAFRDAAEFILPAPDRLTLLVIGGSHGARALNETVTEALATMQQRDVQTQVIHLTGTGDRDWVRERYEEARIPAIVEPFIEKVASLYHRADFAVCRAGASTCAELALFGVPALLVPYPHAANDHQMANARALEKSGAADVVAERDLSASWLVDYLDEMLRNPARRKRMGAAMKARATTNGTGKLADLVERVARGEPMKDIA